MNSTVLTQEEKLLPPVVIRCVQESVVSIFETILGSAPKYTGDSEEKNIGEGVVGIISFGGDVSWLLMLAIGRQSAGQIASGFCGFDVEYESPDMGDVVGELANVLAGDIIARLRSEGVTTAMSLPTIMRGQDVEPLLPRGAPSKKMHFTTAQGALMLKVAGSRPGENVGRTPGT
jgi:CheY-specific phosphatase CheX